MKFLQIMTLLMLVSTAAQAGIDATSENPINDKSLIFPDIFKGCESEPQLLTVVWNSPPGVVGPSGEEGVDLENLQMTMTGNSDDFRYTFISTAGCTCATPNGPCTLDNGESCIVEVVSAPNNPGVKKKKLNFDGSYQDYSDNSIYEVSDSVAIFATSYPAGHPDADGGSHCPPLQ